MPLPEALRGGSGPYKHAIYKQVGGLESSGLQRGIHYVSRELSGAWFSLEASSKGFL